MRNSMISVTLLLFILLVSIPEAAQFDFRHQSTGAGFEVSLAVPDRGLHPTFGAAGLMDFTFNLGDFGDLGIRPNIGFWVSSDKRNWDPSYDLTVFELAFNGDFRYYFPLPQRVKVRPFVGNGMGIVIDFEDYDYDFPFQDLDDNDADAGAAFHFLGGVNFPFTPRILGFGEFKFKLGRYDVFRMTFGMTFAIGR